MPKTVPLPPPGFEELSVEERIAYVQSLWERIAARPEEVPVPEWHRRVLKERLQSLAEHPERERSWPEVRDSIRRTLPDPDG